MGGIAGRANALIVSCGVLSSLCDDALPLLQEQSPNRVAKERYLMAVFIPLKFKINTNID